MRPDSKIDICQKCLFNTCIIYTGKRKVYQDITLFSIKCYCTSKIKIKNTTTYLTSKF